MRAAAEVGPPALAIKLEVLAWRDRVDQFDLERLALGLEKALRLLARDHSFHERLVARDDLAHALLDCREVLGGERLGAVEVVIEAVLDHRSDGDLGIGPERLHRVGEHMGRVVTDQFERARIVARNELEARVLVDAIGEVDKLAVADHCDGALGEGGGDGLGDVEAGEAGLEGAPGAVGKSDVDHIAPLAHSPKQSA